MKRIIKLSIRFVIFPLVVLFVSCGEDQIPQPLEHNSNPPAGITNVTVQNLPGKARITYTLPSDNDLLYVVARYTLENGTPMEAKASYYNNSLLLEGFLGQTTTDVKVYSVNRSETESSPVTVTVAPLKAAIFDIYESLVVQADFGGISINAKNPSKEEIGILVMQKNIQGDLVPLRTSIYTSVAEVVSSLRGFKDEEQEFSIVIRDKWLNYTDTLVTKIKPLFEQLMPKSAYAELRLSNDAQSSNNYFAVKNLWDSEFVEWWGTYFTERTLNIGNHLVTFDVGAITKLSRLRIWNYRESGNLYFHQGSLKKFRIWGSNSLGDNSGNLNDGTWTLMGEFEVKKPSGLPYGQESSDDLVAGRDGADYAIGIDKPAVRYLRIECVENWQGIQFMSVSEVQVYGNPNF